MKNLKILALAAMATMGLTAFVGAGTASATTLFTDSSLTISYPAGTTIHLTLVSNHVASFTINSETTEVCTESTVLGRTSNGTGSTISGSIEALTWGGCTTTADTIANGSFSIDSIGANTGRVIGSGTQVTLKLFSLVSCTYGTGTGTILGTIPGGSEPILSINTTLSKVAGGGFCPSTIGFDGDYIVTQPHAMSFGA